MFIHPKSLKSSHHPLFVGCVGMQILYSVIRGTQPNSHLKFSPVKSAVTWSLCDTPCRAVPYCAVPEFYPHRFPCGHKNFLCRSRGYDDR
ncbi:hypothetical protein RRG08_004278 [Elysia crispata]|uniref:Uncharacterized protein n=1 Tax=Elysia crispata TaxID=231223 RepID=A0AAE1A642_9GAST|nr:hypothetical protein RRG08_004278 [Elysia crispata]